MSLIKKQPARTDCFHDFGENLSFQIVERHYQIELRLLRLEVGEILHYESNVRPKLCGIKAGLLNSDIGNVHQSYIPALLREPNCVASCASRQIESVPPVWKSWPDEFRKGLQQKRVGDRPSVSTAGCGIFLVPAFPVAGLFIERTRRHDPRF